jgi:glutaredoxin 3
LYFIINKAFALLSCSLSYFGHRKGNKMAKVEVYSTTYCPYCVRAKQLLDAKDVDYTEIDVTGDDAARVALVEKSGGRRTVPQIFINGQSIGGYDDLRALEESGKLDGLLG